MCTPSRYSLLTGQYAFRHPSSTDEKARERVRSYQHRSEEELYDITDDPAALNNFAVETEYSSIKKELKTKLEAWMDSQGDQGKSEWTSE